MEESWRQAEDQPQRIRWARLNRTEFARPTDAARSLSVPPGTYRTWELTKADGGREPELHKLQALARKFRVSWQWLLTGRGSPDAPDEEDVMTLATRLRAVPDESRDAAARAAVAVIESFYRKAG